jgi:glycogen operon protein
MKNALTLMLVSQGVPMILMGDEMGRTKQGNNNTYCHDNELNWLDWSLTEENSELLRYAQKMIAFRHAHPTLRNRWHLTGRDYVGSGYADITWHGSEAWNADWSGSSRMLAFMLCGKHARGGTEEDNYIYVAMNMHWEGQWFSLPGLPEGMQWFVAANTGVPAPEDAWDVGQERQLEDQAGILLGDRSIVVLVGK